MTIANTQCKLLAICLPTRNRAAMLAESLAALIERMRPFGIPIHVSDNSTNGDTGKVVQTLQAQYPFLHYSRCERELEADANFERALRLPDTKYRWLFGDHYKIEEGFDLNILLSLLEADHELVALNSRNRIQGIKSGKYADSVFVLEKLGWHLTMMTALIYSDRLLDRIDFKRYYGTFLTQTLSIFDEFSSRELDFYWLANIAIGSYPIDPHESWHPRALTVFVRDWFHGIMSLPPKYGTAAKQVAIMAHASNVSLFSLRGMIYLRALGAIDHAKVRAVKKEIPFVFRFDRRVFLYCSLMIPRFVAELALKGYESLQRRRRRSSSPRTAT
ncbi:MAG TPA: glycosyltransferase [Burkholderiaceae bacterium]|nr:glycosyltransferase [Burkholderiaceae bacterium]